MAISFIARSWVLLVPLIPSIMITIFVLYHLLSNRQLRMALNNHVIILLLSSGLIVELTDVVSHIHYFRTGTALSSTHAFCLVWVFLCATGNTSVYIQMAWASIERHILIFYPSWFATKTKRCVFHYFPLAMCILWPLSFYIVMFFILPCDIPLNYNLRLCSLYVCIIRFSWVTQLDSIINYIMPAFLSVIFSVALFVRVIYHRYRIRRRIQWRNYRKMAIQLLLISVLYTFLQFPPMILYAAYSVGLPRSVGTDYYADAIYFSYWAALFTPFVCVASLPDLQTKCRNVVLFWRRRNVVGPQILPNTGVKVGRTARIPPVIR